ncbi:MAG: GDP-mannose 4,6-dehydratase [bacterium]
MTDWKRVPVLVTGAGGFIASHLVEELARRGAKVRALVHYNSRNHWGNLEFLPKETLGKIEVVAGDVTDPFFMRGATRGQHTVFHLAALIAIPYSYVAPEQYFNVNVKGTLNVCQAALDEKVSKVVHTSTSETYGTAQYVPIDEKHPLQGQSPYSASKIAADKVAESFYLSFGCPVATLRPFNTYGPRQSARAIIPTVMAQVLAGRKKVRLGSLDPVRDLTFVGDTVAGFIAAAESKKTVGEVVNVGNGKGIAIGDLARLILEICESNAAIEIEKGRVRPEKSEVMQLVCNYDKARALMGWKPRTPLRDGLAQVRDFIRAHPEIYKPDIYTL